MPLKPNASFEIFAKDKTKRGVDSASNNLERLRKQISLTGLASVAGAGILGLGAMVGAGLKLGDEMAETAQKLGLTTEGLAGLRHAARLTGVETTKLDLGIQRMTRRIAEAAEGTGEAQGALKELGLDAERLSNLSPDEQFREIAAAMAGVASQSDKVRLGFKLFDSEGVDLIRTLELGADGLDQASREAEKFGTALSAVDAARIGEAGDGIDRAKTAVEGLAIQLAAEFSPAIAGAANAFADWVSFITSTGIPAFRLLAERVGLVGLNVKALTEEELLVRTVTLTDTIEGLQAAIQKAGGGDRNRFGGTNLAFLPSLNDELAKARQQLADVEAQIEKLRAHGGDTTPIAPITVTDSGRVNFEDALAQMREQGEERRKLAGEQAEREKEQADREAQQEAERRAQELEGVRRFLMTREEIEAEAFERRNQIIIDNIAAGDERDQLLYENALRRANEFIDLEREKQAAINQAVERGVATREQFEQASRKSQIKGVLGTLESITAGVAIHDRRLFALNKAAAIGNAIVNTAQGVTKALSAYPPPLSFAMAAAVAAAGAVQIGAIASASFGGGSTPSVVGSTPTLEGQPVTQPTAAPEGGGKVVEVHFHGSGFLGTDDIKKALRDQFDADEVIIHRHSRQAQEIRA